MKIKIKLMAVLMFLSTLAFAACGGGTGGSSVGGEETGPGGQTPKEWGIPVLIETVDEGDAKYPQVAFDPDGNAFAVWCQEHDEDYWIFANRYTVGSGWGNAKNIGGITGYNATYPQIVLDANGNAIAVWNQDEDSSKSIYANHYDNSLSMWGVDNSIETETEEAKNPQIDFDPDGNAIAVWQCWDGSLQYNIQATRRTVSSGWESPGLIEDQAGNAVGPQLAIDPDGNAIAVWQQFHDSYLSIYANRYVAAVSDWGSTGILLENKDGHAYEPQVAVDSDGNAIVVWHQQYDGVFKVIANIYTPGSGWSGDEIISSAVENAKLADVAFDLNGNAIAVWCQNNDSSDVVACRYTAGSGWGTPEIIDKTDASDAVYPHIAFDPWGNAIAVWQQFSSYNDIWINQYTAGEGWRTAFIIDYGYSGHSTDPQIAIDANGNAIVIWSQSNGTCDDIYAVRYE